MHNSAKTFIQQTFIQQTCLLPTLPFASDTPTALAMANKS